MAKVLGLKCLNCGVERAEQPIFDGCPSCRSDDFSSNLVPIYNLDDISKTVSKQTLLQRRPGLWAFKEFLPVNEDHIISLGEGGTPLLNCKELGKKWGINNLYLKDESRNPTHSFKDRLAAVSISKAKEIGVKVATISSTGNHGAAVAAYCAKAGIDCVIFTSEHVPQTMKSSMQVYGAKVVATPSPADRWRLMRECVTRYEWYPVGNYINPPVGSNFYGIEGYKTIAYEICVDLGWSVPDKVIMPTCYADGLSGVWRGFKDFYEIGFVDNLPTMISAERFGPLKYALKNDLIRLAEVRKEPTIAFSIGAGMCGHQGLVTLKESHGFSETVEDNELVEMQKTLGSHGIYAEASSLAALVATKKLGLEGKINPDEVVVAILTSTGLKDPQMTAKHLPSVPLIAPNINELQTALSQSYRFEIPE